MQTTTTALQALLDLAYSVELGNEAIDRETIEAAEARALRASADGPTSQAIRDTHKAADRLIRCRLQGRQDGPYAVNLRYSRRHLQHLVDVASNRQAS